MWVKQWSKHETIKCGWEAESRSQIMFRTAVASPLCPQHTRPLSGGSVVGSRCLWRNVRCGRSDAHHCTGGILCWDACSSVELSVPWVCLVAVAMSRHSSTLTCCSAVLLQDETAGNPASISLVSVCNLWIRTASHVVEWSKGCAELIREGCIKGRHKPRRQEATDLSKVTFLTELNPRRLPDHAGTSNLVCLLGYCEFSLSSVFKTSVSCLLENSTGALSKTRLSCSFLTF